MVLARGPGKFCSLRMTGLKVLKMCPSLENVPLALCFACFLQFFNFDGPGAVQMDHKRFRLPKAEFRQVLHMVRRHLGCTGQPSCHCADTPISGFPQSDWRQVRQSFEDRLCLGPCVSLVRFSCAKSQIVPRSVSTCPFAVTWLTVYRAPQVHFLSKSNSL